jgi:hypothetical protein
MAPESSIARLNGTYRTAGTYRGQTGTLWSTNTRSARTPSQVGVAGRRFQRNELRRTKVREFVMAGVVAVTVALFLGGVVTGVIVVVALAVRREDRRYTLVREAPDRMSHSARRLNGVGSRNLDAEFFPVVRKLAH